ncbi:MAG: FeoA family protein [Propionivibrio sp.]
MKADSKRASFPPDEHFPTLDRAVIGQALIVQDVSAPQAAPEWVRWLEEIGFIHGEQVMLMARAMPGGDPLVIRVGQSTFALRRAEAACIRVAARASVGKHASTLRAALASASVAA